MIHGLTNAGATPALEKLMQFASRRHEILANNIANLSTPGFRAEDVSVRGFQEQLGEAIDRRRAQAGGASGGSVGDLRLKDTAEVSTKDGRLLLNPEPVGGNILFHDGGARDLERSMQDLVENFMAFRTAAQFMRRELETIKTAIRERM